VSTQGGPGGAGTDAEAVEAVGGLLNDLYAIACVCELAELGVADALGPEPASAAQLARVVGANADALHRALRLVASHGLFVALADGRFAHSPRSRVLRRDHPQSLRDWLRWRRTPVAQRVLAGLGHSLRTGRPALELISPQGMFGYLAAHPEEGLVFNQAMLARSQLEIRALLGAYDFSRFGSIADVGGGQGHLLKAVLEAAPRARGVLFDLPHAIDAARGLASERMTLQSGSFFTDPLPVCDAYLLKKVIHDWSDGESVAILRAVRRAAPEGATLLLIEADLPAGPEPHPAKALDLMMLVWLTGRERTAAEYERLLNAAGFRLERIIPAHPEVSIFEALSA